MATSAYTLSTLRVYDKTGAKSSTRVLVDRVWPRGLTKSDVSADIWLKDVAPSTGLRKWFDHDPAKWATFCDRYFSELRANDNIVRQLVTIWQTGNLVLLYSARDTEHNQAVALERYLRTVDIE